MAEITRPQDDGFAEGSSKWLKTPGIYHVIVEHIDENPTSRSNERLDAIRVLFTVLGGPEAGKQFDIAFWNESETASEGANDWACRKRWRLWDSLGCANDSIAKGETKPIDWQDGVHRQCIIELELKGKYIDVHYANIWHVDDKRVSHVIKDEKMIASLPSRFRQQREQAGKTQTKIDLSEL